MSEQVDDFLESVERQSEDRSRSLERLFSAADAEKVFSQPFTSGEYTVITAAEVGGGGGFGSGMGFGPGRTGLDHPAGAEEAGASVDSSRLAGAGGGGGGGGGSMGRPVAAIVVGPDGVEVKPLFDLTKIGLAALTAFGGLAVLAVKTLGKR